MLAPRTEKCRNCSMPVLASDARCPFCGKRRKYRELTRDQKVRRVMACFWLAVIGLPLAFVGACSVFSARGVTDPGYKAIPIFFGLIAFALFALVLWSFISAWRS